MSTGAARATLAMALLVLAVVAGSGGDEKQRAAVKGCDGRVAVIELPRSEFPRIVDHIEDSWAACYPRVLRVNREGSERRRDRLLSRWEARHPQPKGDGLDLDEEPAAVLRRSWMASVRPIAQRENRRAGQRLGAELRGVPNGACVRYDFND
jgi:hypothetical protein